MIFLPAQRFKISLKTIQYNFQYPLSHLHTSPKVYLMFEKMTYLFFASVWHTSYPSSTLKKKIAHFCSFSRYCDFMKKLQQKKIYLYFKNLVTIVSTVWTTITFNAINKVCSIKTPNIGLFFSFLILCNVTIFPQKGLF